MEKKQKELSFYLQTCLYDNAEPMNNGQKFDTYEIPVEVWICNDTIENGGLLVMMELPLGEYTIAKKKVQIKNCSMLPLHFVSRDTGHPLVEGFKPDDFKYWYDGAVGYITPLLDATVQVEGSAMILTSGNQDDNGNWEKTGAAVEYGYGLGKVRICQVKLTGRISMNPVAKEFGRRLLRS